MSVLKQELINCINDIPDEKLIALKPLLYMLIQDTMIIEEVNVDDLTEDEKASVLQAELEFENGETVSHDDINWD